MKAGVDFLLQPGDVVEIGPLFSNGARIGSARRIGSEGGTSSVEGVAPTAKINCTTLRSIQSPSSRQLRRIRRLAVATLLSRAWSSYLAIRWSASLDRPNSCPSTSNDAP